MIKTNPAALLFVGFRTATTINPQNLRVLSVFVNIDPVSQMPRTVRFFSVFSILSGSSLLSISPQKFRP
jgi:hypothetical protein